MTETSKQPWLTIIGISETGFKDLSQIAKSRLETAKHIFGSERQLNLIPEAETESSREIWPSPMQPRLETLLKEKPAKTIIIATGDPTCWGIAEYITSKLNHSELEIIPSQSIITVICSKMHWSSATTESLSLCSQPIEVLNRLLEPGKNIIILSANNDHPLKVAKLLCDHGFEHSNITILEKIGSVAERKTTTTAKALLNETNLNIAPLNSLAIELKTNEKFIKLTTNPGLPDAIFDHDGQMTKQNMRAITLAHLRPSNGELLWDIGSGNGSISIEWLRAAKNTKAIGIEINQDRINRAERNASNLGVPDFKIIKENAETAIEILPTPDAIFIGGGITTKGLLNKALSSLKPEGRLVANTVTIEGEACLIKAHNQYGGSLSKISMSSADNVGRFHGWRPSMPITQWVYLKTS